MTVSKLLKSCATPPDSFHFLSLAQCSLGLQPISDFLSDSLLQPGVEFGEFALGFPALMQFAFGGLEESRVVDRHGGLSSECPDEIFGAGREHGRAGMTKEEPA